MDFPFPDIKKKCPVCKGPGCAIWKGYYKRNFFCMSLDISEKLAIHVGRCPTKKKDFSYLPDFLIPYQILSRSTLILFIGFWLKFTHLSKATEALTQDSLEPSYFPSLSTTWGWLKLALTFCRMNTHILKVADSHVFSSHSDLSVFKTSDEIPFLNIYTHWPRYICPNSQPP